MKLIHITREKLEEIVRSCTSISQVVIALNMNGGGSHRNVSNRIKDDMIDVSHFKGRGWNKGLTKDTCEKINEYSKKISNVLSKRPGRPLSAETKRKISQKRIQYLERNHHHGLKWYSVSNGKVDIRVQGTWEKIVAEWLTANQICWERKRIQYGIWKTYTPDFYLPDFDFYIEVKGFWRQRDIQKIASVLSEHNVDIRIIDKRNIRSLNLNLPKFEELFDICPSGENGETRLI